ncbi:MAG: NAD(P)-dependent oxidoreductase [Burkholderiales bacterium]
MKVRRQGMKIGFIGLGRMGSGMVSRLLATGHEVIAFNRTAERMRELVAQGATGAKTIAECCEAEVVFSMLANDAAVEDTTYGADGLLAHLKPHAVHVSCSTISVALAERLARAHAEKRQDFVSSPVFGRPDAAAAGKLFLVLGGNAEVIERLQTVFDDLGQRSYRMSDEPSKANLVKLSGNFLIATVIESLGEAMALAEKGGVDRHQYLELLTSSIFNVPIYKNYGGMIADRRFEPAGFAAELGQKDMRLVLAAAETLKVPLPFAGILRDRFIELAAQGDESLDWSAVGGLAAKAAALLPD